MDKTGGCDGGGRADGQTGTWDSWWAVAGLFPGGARVIKGGRGAGGLGGLAGEGGGRPSACTAIKSTRRSTKHSAAQCSAEQGRAGQSSAVGGGGRMGVNGNGKMGLLRNSRPARVNTYCTGSAPGPASPELWLADSCRHGSSTEGNCALWRRS